MIGIVYIEIGSRWHYHRFDTDYGQDSDYGFPLCNVGRTVHYGRTEGNNKFKSFVFIYGTIPAISISISKYIEFVNYLLNKYSFDQVWVLVVASVVTMATVIKIFDQFLKNERWGQFESDQSILFVSDRLHHWQPHQPRSSV